ncbi:MAG TPA: CDP-diacylglycerol--serine O-phosphatidyltransferase [Fulvivirga sp.]|nr:CDP-diacylglycerol--serine O-phosphatidyltransferase [Fulvivirga sp.]
MNPIKHIPNLLTSANLFCGCVGIVFCFNGELTLSVYLIWLAMLFDFSDGFAARLLKVSSPIGKQLDSLADMVTFGLLPSVILFQLLSAHVDNYLPYMAFLVAIFSALRLAKFNVDENQETVFIGLPTPANALFLSSLIFVFDQYPVFNNVWIIIGITVVFSLLLVAPVELMALKFKNYSWKDNSTRFLFLTLSIIFIIVFKLVAMPLIILAYLLMSLFTKPSHS